MRDFDQTAYELLMLLCFLRDNRGTFELKENGRWIASLDKKSWKGTRLTAQCGSTLREAYAYLFRREEIVEVCFPDET